MHADVSALVSQLADALLARRWRLACAESCTGGLIAAACTDRAGSSDWFERGVVSYSNDAKVALLGVPAALIAAHGAVSEPVARAMAEGIVRSSGVDLAVSVTGVAGPSGGTPAKPVGLTYVALVDAGRHDVRRFIWAGDRASNKLASALALLELLVERVGGGAPEPAPPMAPATAPPSA